MTLNLFTDIPVLPRAIIYSYCDQEEQDKVTKVFAESVPDEVRYPFHYFDQTSITELKKTYEYPTTVYARRVYEKFSSPRQLLDKTERNPKDTPAMRAFENKDYQLACFYIRNGGAFPIEEHPLIEKGDNLYWDWFNISDAVTDAIWNSRKPANPLPVQNMFDTICRRGNRVFLKWFFSVASQDRSFFAHLKIGPPLIEAIKSGFVETVKIINDHIELKDVLNKEGQSLCVTLGIEHGYPKIPSILNFPIDEKQQQLLEKLTATMESEKKETAEMNSTLSSTHGGKKNEETYKKEYKKAVAFAYFTMKNYRYKNKYSDLLVDLGRRRYRMAVLGGLEEAEEQGLLMPDERTQSTKFGNPYAFEERVKEKYQGKTIRVTLNQNNETINLTIIHPDKWAHPLGKEGKKVLPLVNEICNQMENKASTSKEEFVENIGKVIWALAHGAPWARGTPTITYIFVDALCKLYNYPPLNKTPDLNCEALLCGYCKEFLDQLAARKDLFLEPVKADSEASKPLSHESPTASPSDQQ